MAGRLSAVAPPAPMASRVANAAGNHGSCRRSRAVSSRVSPAIVMPTAKTLGAISASLPLDHMTAALDE
ncbi:hypothetical protein ABZ612_26390 [Streptomyces avermitilis]|uniref:hypothetical protein n=1 Tax=Streptomyces avermitilis TaxID=33903 RepID=UPI0033D34577